MCFKELRDNQDFTDITLACDDSQQIEVHKFILASTSPLFKDMLRRNQHSHPLIYMRGVRFKDLTSIVEFIYHGETNIYKEDLNDFMALAEELQLKGLTADTKPILDAKDENISMKHQQVNYEMFNNTASNDSIDHIEEKISDNHFSKQ